MCVLELGLLSASDVLPIVVPCEYKAVGDKFVERLGAMRTWPKMEVTTLTFGPDEDPYVIRMENVWMATMSPCADYRAYLRQQREAEENERLLTDVEDAGKPLQEKS